MDLLGFTINNMDTLGFNHQWGFIRIYPLGMTYHQQPGFKSGFQLDSVWISTDGLLNPAFFFFKIKHHDDHDGFPGNSWVRS